jgi:CheY-like chemotaxis protein
MVVDDEPTVAKLIHELLACEDYQSEIFFHPVEALERFRENPDSYDLLVTDQTMPELSGAELAREVMQIRKNFPVIICTGYSSSITAELAESIGIRAYFSKPLDMMAFLAKVSEVLAAQDAA